MSTTISSLVSSRTVVIGASSTRDRVYLSIEGDVSAAITAAPADLLAALRAEGILPAEPEPLADWERDLLADASDDAIRTVPADAVVIPAGASDGFDPDDMRPGNEHTAEAHRSMARYHAKAAEWYDAHPPVDAEQVEAMSEVLRREHAWGRKASDDMARALYLAGARIEATS